MRELTDRVSRRLQDLTHDLESLLQEAAEEPLPFFLAVVTDDVAQYTSNMDARDIPGLLSGFLEQCKESTTYIPAHENEALFKVPN